ncbi:MAG TPA: hypothetical protein VKM35_11515 [Arenimonas sp.]|uniref:hypothetical protein n=1 Tax=Arenimonas sp. TaxID=1872635 RepID=UPI002CDDBBCB|nr:hypothetical protein [Arenimonas sp.]HMB57820.1 hypothetical protein [Arenimonas sp.]
MSRDFSKVSPQFWTGTTGKNLRGHAEAQIVALYLMTSPHSTMTGVFTVPILYIAHETGLSAEGASKGLTRCIDEAFCTYDQRSETVFVHAMAGHQVGTELKSGDKRLIGVRKQYDHMPDDAIKAAFFRRYGDAYGLSGPLNDIAKESPSQAPSKPGAVEGAVAIAVAGERSPKGACTFSKWIESLEGKEAIPPDDPVFLYAETVGIPADYLALAWAWFERTYGSGGTRSGKRYSRWPQVFRKAVEDNWPKAWFADGDGFKLSTVGIQLQREMRAAA